MLGLQLIDVSKKGPGPCTGPSNVGFDWSIVFLVFENMSILTTIVFLWKLLKNAAF